MTIGVLWEFIECFADLFLGQDMQKDFIVQNFQSVSLDPTHSQKIIAVKNITDTVIHTADGKTYTIEGGYLDIGILDTMKDLFVNFIGAVVFSTLGYFYVKRREKLNAEENRTDKLTRSLIVRNIMDEDEEFRAEEERYQENQEAAAQNVGRKYKGKKKKQS